MTIYVPTTTIAPYAAVVYITVTFNNGESYTGSGVVIDRNTVLTAAHVIYGGKLGLASVSNIKVYPGHTTSSDPFGSFTPVQINYYPVDPDGDHSVTSAESQYDIATLSFSTAIGDRTGWMGIDPNFTSGTAHVTGFPGVYGRRMTDDQGLVTYSNNVVNIGNLEVNPGNSGGPVWAQEALGAYVVGIVSTGSWGWSPHGPYGSAVLGWMKADDYMVGSSTPVVTDDYGSGTSTLGKISVGGTVKGNVERAGDNDWFAVTLTAGVTYNITLTGASTSAGTLSDPYLTVYNSSGTSVATDDDSGAGLDALLSYKPTSSGTYYLGAGSATSSGTGTYAVSIAATASAVPVSPSTTASKPIFTIPEYAKAFPLDQSAVTIRPDGVASTADAVIDGSINNTTTAKLIDYDTWSVTFQAGYEYTIENYFNLTSNLYEGIALYDPANGNFYWSYSYSVTETAGEAFSPKLRFDTATTLYLTVYNDVDYGKGVYRINIYADRVSTGSQNGTAGADTLTGTANADTMAGFGGDDTLRGNGGNDALDGGAGRDTAIFSGARANYQITRNSVAGTISVQDYVGSDGTDTMANIEMLQFSDRLMFNMTGDDAQIIRLYQAALGRTPDVGGLLVQLNAHDAGTSVRQLANNFIGSAEFRAKFGQSTTNDQYVGALYQNVLGRSATTAEIQFQVHEALEKGTARDTLLLGFVNSAENVSRTADLFV